MERVRSRLLVFGLLMAGMMLLVQPMESSASSSYVDLQIPGVSRDIGAGQVKIEGGFSVSGGTAHYWNAKSGYSTVNLSTGAVTDMGAPKDFNSNSYGDPFGLYDPTGNAFYAATFLNGGQSYVYKYDYASSQWSQGVEAVNIYGGAVHNGEVYLSGLREPWSGGFDTNYISLFDNFGGGYHDALIQVGGASAHVALDNDGNVYYSNYTTTGTTQLTRWTAEQVAGVKNDLAGGDTDTFLSLADGETLSTLPGGANGITVDDAGHVFISTNAYPNSSLLMWNGEVGDGNNFDLVATNPDGSFAWFGPMDIEGDFTKGDALYGSYGWNGPITEITAAPVPVPGALWLLGSGLVGVAGFRRRQNQ